MPILVKIIWIIFAIPLIAYPVILLACVMSLGAESKSNDKLPLLINLARLAFLWGCLLYPVLYYILYEFAKSSSSNEWPALLIQFVFILVLFFAFKLWEKPVNKK